MEWTYNETSRFWLLKSKQGRHPGYIIRLDSFGKFISQENQDFFQVPFNTLIDAQTRAQEEDMAAMSSDANTKCS